MTVDEHDYHDVFTSVSPLSAKWHNLCCALGLTPSQLSQIESDRHVNVEACLRDGLTYWLRENHNTKKHGLPTWRRLVEAVDKNNHALALKIAKQHNSELLVPEESSESLCIAADWTTSI